LKHIAKNTFFVLLISLSMGLFGLVYAQDDNAKIDKSQAAQKAQQQVQGRVLKVDQSKNKYRVKVLQKSGRVVNVDVDKRSGRVLKSGKKDD
tara:strand:+ start:2005 stop:2280 length:276 start_codon:yes stop_codon:yes gene_type:complete